MSEQRCTVNDIDEIWINRKRKAKKTVKRDEYEGKPDFTKTLHRTVNKLTKMDYISKEEGHPAKYYMNENQRFMYRLTVKRDV